MPIGGPNGPAQVQVYTNRTAVRFAVSSLDRDLIRTPRALYPLRVTLLLLLSVSDPTTHRLRRWVTGDLFGLTSTITTEIDSYLYLVAIGLPISEACIYWYCCLILAFQRYLPILPPQ
ncbi:uncharacterized protein N7525_009697 [Penicillium rubens]|uniref:uncharacterized protein n=1 Tax=Penicillium rubens TaxID=1108849 RepID=UPI002A5A939A|nr:uncharacterized protein N7525_009697 [Penicillium rubens]KAJ5831444.1 hypothetical protein N7525_009697 [Penicillium rubens]KAJ5854987.1 hypothetical protein N7534_007530 [Penicillium rubens]